MDSDSSSNDESDVYRVVNTPRISQDQLANALMLAGSTTRPMATNQIAPVGNPIESLPSTSSTTTNPGGPFVTSSALNNALQNAFQRATPNSAVQQTQQLVGNSEPADIDSPVPTSATDDESPMDGIGGQFSSELAVMRDMGLTDETRNVQMLILCGGNVEQAINLMLSGSI